MNNKYKINLKSIIKVLFLSLIILNFSIVSFIYADDDEHESNHESNHESSHEKSEHSYTFSIENDNHESEHYSKSNKVVTTNTYVAARIKPLVVNNTINSTVINNIDKQIGLIENNSLNNSNINYDNKTSMINSTLKKNLNNISDKLKLLKSNIENLTSLNETKSINNNNNNTVLESSNISLNSLDSSQKKNILNYILEFINKIFK